MEYPHYLTTGEVATRCGVTRITVLRWIRNNKLVAFRLPGSHYRISEENYDKFARQYGLPTATPERSN
jgi:excisionase family DNA binding protein